MSAAMMKLFTCHWFLTITHDHIALVGTPILKKYQFLTFGSWFNRYHIAQFGSPSDKALILTTVYMYLTLTNTISPLSKLNI